MLDSVKKLFSSPALIAALLLLIFLATTGYIYGWDDQHLEIPLLKSLINPSLYQGDYYVQSLQKNFTSFFYPVLARCITVNQIRPVYFLLFLFSRFLMFFWIYKIWVHVSRDRFRAFWAIITFMVSVRVEEFLYRTFSHQEFALGFMFAAIYFFFKDRFYLASLILGLTANIHALYSLFPMIFILTYLLLNIREHGWKKLFLSAGIFTATCLPFVIWTISNKLHGPGVSTEMMKDWIENYVLACPQNFFLIPGGSWRTFLPSLTNYGLLAVLLAFNLMFNAAFRENKKAIAISIAGTTLLFICFMFTYVFPNKFILDLNLIRNYQFLHFFLFGFTFLFLFERMEKEPVTFALLLAVFFVFFKYKNPTILFSMTAIFLFFTMRHFSRHKKNWIRQIILGLILLDILGLCGQIIYQYNIAHYKYLARISIGIISVLLLTAYAMYFRVKTPGKKLALRRAFYLIPLIIFSLQYCHYHLQHNSAKAHAFGFWRMQDSWEDMQRYVRQNTPKNAMILVPHNMEMGGFRIQSERTIVASYRDCGLIAFDYPAVVEWKNRITDIASFRVILGDPIQAAVKTAISKYGADYIVFLRYAAPSRDVLLLKKIYTNSDFVLFKVNKQ